MNKLKRTLVVMAAAMALAALSLADVRGSQESAADAAVQTGQTKAAEYNDGQIYLKTYDLKYINATEFMKSAKLYVLDYAGTESTISVQILGKYIPEFEALMKKLDVEKKNIQFQIITIVASKEVPDDRIKDQFVMDTQGITEKDLRRVLDEMKGLWNFKFYRVHSPSFLIVKDGTGQSHFKLASGTYDFDMNILHVNLRGTEPGKRIISVGQIQLNQGTNRPDSTERYTLLDTSDITFKENGYLVVGVSGFHSSWSGLALILVIRADVK